jgi:hypothetical protein
VRKVQKLASHRTIEPVNAGDPITNGQDGAGLHDGDLLVVLFDLLADDFTDFFCADLHGPSCHGRHCGLDIAIRTRVASSSRV